MFFINVNFEFEAKKYIYIIYKKPTNGFFVFLYLYID